MGECYFAEKHFDRAAAELLKVDIVYGYPKWSARALYEAGRAFEQLNEADQAKAQYELCIKKYKDFDSSALAKKRLKALENP
jgi:TolA-binding protein